MIVQDLVDVLPLRSWGVAMQRHVDVENVLLLASSPRGREPGNCRSAANVHISGKHFARIRPKLGLNTRRIAVSKVTGVVVGVLTFATHIADHHD